MLWFLSVKYIIKSGMQPTWANVYSYVYRRMASLEHNELIYD